LTVLLINLALFITSLGISSCFFNWLNFFRDIDTSKFVDMINNDTLNIFFRVKYFCNEKLAELEVELDEVFWKRRGDPNRGLFSVW
jgi:hypothetical protein